MSEAQVSNDSGASKADMLKVYLEARVKAAVEKARAKARPEEAEPYGWWNLLAAGPWQNFAPGSPLPPHQVIKSGESAFFAVAVLLNPEAILPPAPGMSPCQVLSDFGLPYEIKYQTCNLTTCSTGGPNGVIGGNLISGQCIYVHVEEFTPTEEGLFTTHISTRILGVNNATDPHYAGFARWVFDFDGEAFFWAPTPGWQFDQPMKYMVYS